MRLTAPNYAYANPFLEPVSLEAMADRSEGATPAERIVDPAADPEQAFERAETEVLISRFLDTLDARDRSMVVEIYWDDANQADIARAFHVSGAAISKRLARIVARGKVALAPLRDTLSQ